MSHQNPCVNVEIPENYLIKTGLSDGIDCIDYHIYLIVQMIVIYAFPTIETSWADCIRQLFISQSFSLFDTWKSLIVWQSIDAGRMYVLDKFNYSDGDNRNHSS